MKKATAKARKISKVLREYKAGKLKSGSKKGPKVKSRAQAIAIAVKQGRQAAGERENG